MNGERLYFRTRGGPTQGWGNVFRLASFADACRAAGHDATTFLAEGPSEVVRYLEARGFQVTALEDGVDLELEERILEAHGPADAIFVEMLDITPERQAMLRRHTQQLIVFDDLCDHIYDADWVEQPEVPTWKRSPDEVGLDGASR